MRRPTTSSSNDERNVGRLLNNLGGLNFQLGKPEKAVEDLKSAYRVLLDKGSEAEAANVVSSLAHVHLMTGQVDSAEEEARHALDLLEGREDFLLDIAPTQLVLGRSLMEQGRLDEAQEMLRTAEASARTARIDQPSRRRVDGTGRSRRPPRRGRYGCARCTARPRRLYRMSASKPRKEVTMNKARLISLMVSLSLVAFYLEGFRQGPPLPRHPGSWFDGH